ncbi:MAG: polymerase [Francisellaceae bacterium]|nr:polymerase [Francisellaceae bacterium]
MSYQVFARKWRPRSFKMIKGQSATCQALSNALDNDRLHHAYLFTGSSGIGKTTLARVMAKCLNCLEGITSTPCEQCESCKAIDEGRFIDVIEVDAASKTKIEDTRSLLDNVQYLPSIGRFKIYIIDEVHMLSMHSFNALLKTLEEPPQHVKFLLATTDPHKLPSTVLSRCLQFHLKSFSVEQIALYLNEILELEKLDFEKDALLLIGKKAHGSMRDALSLLEQALSLGFGQIKTTDVEIMLGISSDTKILGLLKAIIENDMPKILTVIEALTEDLNLDFLQLLNEIINLFFQMALLQKVPNAVIENKWLKEELLNLSTKLSAENIQMYYQIGLNGLKDLSFAPDLKTGFLMTLLRMVAFHKPIIPSLFIKTEPMEVLDASLSKLPEVVPKSHSANIGNLNDKEETPSDLTLKNKEALSQEVHLIREETKISEWSAIVSKLSLSALAKQLAYQCVMTELKPNLITLSLEEAQKPLLTLRQKELLNQALDIYFGKKIKLEINIVAAHKTLSPHKMAVVQEETQYENAVLKSNQDPVVLNLIENFGATLDKISVNKGFKEESS